MQNREHLPTVSDWVSYVCMFERGRVYTEQHSQDLSRVSIALRLPQLGRAKTSFAETTAEENERS